MPKLILLPVRGQASDAPAYATALAAARLFDGHISVLHVRPDVQRDVAALAAADMGMATGLEATLTRLEVEANAREQAAVAAWRGFAGRNAIVLEDRPGTPGLSTEFLTETGNEADWVAEHGRTVDLVVAGRGESGSALDVIEAALLDTGKPVLIAAAAVPTSGPTLDGTVAIAWKDCKEAAAAVSAALPFIRRAGRVLIFTVDEGADQADRSPARLAHALRWHNGNVAVKLLPKDTRPPATALLAAVTSIGCDLLVMGGYGHARLREAVFGGFTLAVLDDAPLPVLMAH
ncbi:MAG: universal stress protein [Acetobacteraceae bacterium]|nr:universal stress protein [Acetobacteraceae bacterium]